MKLLAAHLSRLTHFANVAEPRSFEAAATPFGGVSMQIFERVHAPEGSKYVSVFRCSTHAASVVQLGHALRTQGKELLWAMRTSPL